MIGAIVFTFFIVWIANVTKAWLLYLGLFFVGMVLFAPGGMASLIVANLSLARAGLLGRLAPVYGALAAAGLVALAGFVALIEMLYHLELEAVNDPVLRLVGLRLDVRTVAPWIIAALVLAAGAALYHRAWRRFRARWEALQESAGTA